jgi:hypothetical protein
MPTLEEKELHSSTQRCRRARITRRDLVVMIWSWSLLWVLASCDGDGGCGSSDSPRSACLRPGASESALVPVYSRPDATKRPINRLMRGARVDVLRGDDGWSRISYLSPLTTEGEGRRETGWIRARELAVCGSRPDAALHAEGGVEGRALRLCWWNNRRVDDGPKDYEAMARALEGCQLVGLAEVTAEHEPLSLATALGSTWTAAVSTPEPTSSGARLAYALLFDRRVIDLGLSGAGATRGLSPGDFEGESDRPWALPLRAGGLDVVIVMLRSTLAQGSGDAAHHGAQHSLSWARRQLGGEARIVIFAAAREKPSGAGWASVVEGWRALITQGSTRFGASGPSGEVTDTILVERAASEEWIGEAGVAELASSETEGAERVSDHLPVWFELRPANHQR